MPHDAPTQALTADSDASARAVADAPPLRKSPWTARQKLIRALWMTFGRAAWLFMPGARAAMIRAFGGTVGEGCTFARDVEITIPWNLHIGDRVRVSARAILYSLGPITIGDDTILDYAAHICAGTHDPTDTRFTLLKTPVAIGHRCFVGIDAYIGPGVHLADDSFVWHRASVHRSYDHAVTLRGNPGVPDETPRDAGGD